MNTTEAFQRTFAAHLRDPEANPPPSGVDVARAGVYVELVFNNVEDFLASCFPVIRQILDDAEWKGLARRFYAEHASQSPYFREIPAEFMEWLIGRFASLPLAQQYPFLLEMAHYEWLEIPLSTNEAEIDWDSIAQDGDLMAGKPVLNPAMLLQSYQYPVHRIAPDYLPKEPEPVYMVLLRDRDGKIQFINLNAPTARLMQLLQEDMDTLSAIRQLADEMRQPLNEQFLQLSQQILEQLKTQFVILGASKI